MSVSVIFGAALMAVVAGEAGSGNWLAGQLGGLLALIAGQGVLVALEFSLARLRSGQIELLVEEGDKRAERVREVLEDLPACLATVQVVLSVLTVALGWWSGALFVRMCTEWAPLMEGAEGWPWEAVLGGAFFLVVCWLHLSLAALAPKMLALRHAVGIARWSAGPLLAAHRVMRPLSVLLLRGVERVFNRGASAQQEEEKETGPTDEELKVLLEETEEKAGDESLGREILRNALELKNRVACDIMTPRAEVVFLDLEDDFEEQMRAAIESRHTRFPLCRGHIDEAVGLVHVKDLLALVRDGRRDLMSVRREIHHVSEMMPLEKLLRFFLSKRAHLAIVVDEYGGALGIVTLDNVIEELVGSIHDEFDAAEEPPYRKISEDEFEVDGAMPLHDVGELIGEEIEHEDVSTIGGYLTAELGHIPVQGEQVEVCGFVATVAKSDPRRVLRVHFKRKSAAVPEGAKELADGEAAVVGTNGAERKEERGAGKG